MIYKSLNNEIIGQVNCKKEIISNLYKLISLHQDKPVVLLFYGPSGTGKTETAKTISHVLGGELLRIQFSMMQTNEAYNYIFGSEHSKDSFAKDLTARESDIILIDEFDKVNPIFYNAFYELFDEGRYVDTDYDVNLKNSIFICTSNFNSEDEVKGALGAAMYSRIGCFIKYENLYIQQKIKIVEIWYNKIIELLKDDEKEIIENTNILQWFKDNIERYDNIQLLKTKMENAIYEVIAEKIIMND